MFGVCTLENPLILLDSKCNPNLMIVWRFLLDGSFQKSELSYSVGDVSQSDGLVLSQRGKTMKVNFELQFCG